MGYQLAFVVRLRLRSQGKRPRTNCPRTKFRTSRPCPVSWAQRPKPHLVLLKLGECCLLLKVSPCCAVSGHNRVSCHTHGKAVSSKGPCAFAHGSSVLMGGGKALLGGSCHWAFGVFPWPGYWSSSSFHLLLPKHHEMRGSPSCLPPAIWHCHTTADGHRVKQPQMEPLNS